MQDLVRPRAPDARDHALVAQERVQPPRLARQDLGKPLRPETERLRAEVLELSLRGFGCQQPHARALLRARLGQDELAAALEAQPERRRLRASLAAAQVAQAPGAHQVHVQDELAVVGRKAVAYGAPLDAGQPPPVERRERRVVRLQRRHVRGPGLLDGKGAHGIVERPAERFNFG